MSRVPFVEYVREDKSKYTTAIDAGYYDPDKDFLIGDSGGFLMNINFIFVNTHLLRKAAIHFEKFGTYTDDIVDTPSHRRFRIQEETRRMQGFIAKCKLLHCDVDRYNIYIRDGQTDKANELVKPLRITGEHYNYINYGLISKLDETSITITSSGKVTGVKSDGVPLFFGSQYWWFKSKDFARKNGYHIICGKARRAGFSYMEAIGSANSINLNPSSTVIHAASDFKYLTKGRSISRMSLMQLTYYELNTPFKRGIISRDLEDIQLGYKTKKNDSAGFQSHILSLSITPSTVDAAIGKDAIEIKCEELSAFENFDPFMTVTEPTTRTGSIVTGFISAWGTGGSENANWEVFEKNFYNPSGFSFMPFENIWDIDSRDKVCGYFKPYIDSLQGFTRDGIPSLDKDGNTNYDIAIQISEEERVAARQKAKTIQEFIVYCGQYANMPSEAFSSTTENLFSSEILNNHVNKIRHNPDYKFHVDGMLNRESNGKVKFKTNTRLHDEGFKTHSYIEDVPPRPGTDPMGCLRIWHHPYIDNKTGLVPGDNMYSVSYDPVGKDKETVTSKNSYNSISVWMNPNPYFHNVTKLRVANYFGRPMTMEEADEIALHMCLYYGGHPRMLLAEINRGETKSNFKKWGYTKLLAKSPVVVWDTKIKETTVNDLGIDISNDIRKLQGLKLLQAMLYRVVGKDDDNNEIVFLQTIPDLAFLLELQKWRIDGNFDRVSEAIIEAFADKKLELTVARWLKKTAEATKTLGVFERDWN